MWIVESSALALMILTPNVGAYAVDRYFSDINSNWFKRLNKPYFVLPNRFFQSTWTVVLTSMGLAAYLAWRNQDENCFLYYPLLTYFAQLSLTWMWTPVFFHLRSPLAGLIHLGVLTLTLDVCSFQFFQVNKVAGVLLLPYQFWLIYICYLNYSLYVLNMDSEDLNDY